MESCLPPSCSCHVTGVAGPPSLEKQGAAGFAGRKLAPGNAARLVGSTWLGKQQVGALASLHVMMTCDVSEG
jgi:hypothetical protein